MAAATAFTVLVGLLALFHAALALGAPWGRLAWGGEHAGPLPSGLRLGSAGVVVMFTALAVAALDLAGVLGIVGNDVSRGVMWVATGLFALSFLGNLLSRSRVEKALMSPLALVLSVLALLVSLGGPVPSTFEGMVLDTGEGAVFCTTVMESYPPQCGRDSPHVTGWSWDGVAHEEAQGIRWGSYRFQGVLDGDTLTAIGAVGAVE